MAGRGRAGRSPGQHLHRDRPQGRADLRPGPLPGPFNVANTLAAIVTLAVAGVDPQTAADGVAAVPGVPGRLERVDAGQPYLAVVDYAHKTDAVESVLRSLQKVTEGRVHIVLGCGGDRDTTKRGPMGAAAARLADTAVLTSDNPRSEDPLAILAAMLIGAAEVPVHERGEVIVEADRAAAIAAAVARAEPGDTVLVAGKGHEQGQDIHGVVRPFDDRQVLREAIERSPGRTSAVRAPRTSYTPRTTVRDDQVIALSLAEIAGIVGGQPHDVPDLSAVVTGPVVIDSREVRQGSLFAAFAGERVDGHDFARGAVEAARWPCSPPAPSASRRSSSTTSWERSAPSPAQPSNASAPPSSR